MNGVGARFPSRKGFTLVELVMAIAVLSLASLFLVQVFLSADRLAQKASDIDRAVALCSSTIERWKAGDAPEAIEAIPVLEDATLVPELKFPHLVLATSYLDRDMKSVEKASAAFILTFDVLQEGDLAKLTISIRDVDQTEPLCAYEAAEWFGGSEARG